MRRGRFPVPAIPSPRGRTRAPRFGQIPWQPIERTNSNGPCTLRAQRFFWNRNKDLLSLTTSRVDARQLLLEATCTIENHDWRFIHTRGSENSLRWRAHPVSVDQNGFSDDGVWICGGSLWLFSSGDRCRWQHAASSSHQFFPLDWHRLSNHWNGSLFARRPGTHRILATSRTELAVSRAALVPWHYRCGSASGHGGVDGDLSCPTRGLMRSQRSYSKAMAIHMMNN